MIISSRAFPVNNYRHVLSMLEFFQKSVDFCGTLEDRDIKARLILQGGIAPIYREHIAFSTRSDDVGAGPSSAND